MGGNNGQIWTDRKQDGQKRNASKKTWNIAIGERWKGGRRKEQKAGDRHWLVRSA